MIDYGLASTLLNGLWAQMRQRASWHHNHGAEHRPYEAVEVYDSLARELRKVGFDPASVSVHDMISNNPDTTSRNRAVQMFVYLLRQIADSIEREGTLRVTQTHLKTKHH